MSCPTWPLCSSILSVGRPPPAVQPRPLFGQGWKLPGPRGFPAILCRYQTKHWIMRGRGCVLRQAQRQLPPSNLSLCFQGIEYAQGSAGLDGALPHVCHPPWDLLFQLPEGSLGLRLQYIWDTLQPHPQKICSVSHLSCSSLGPGGGGEDLENCPPQSPSSVSLSSLKVIEEEQSFPQLSYSWVPLIQALCRDIREET